MHLRITGLTRSATNGNCRPGGAVGGLSYPPFAWGRLSDESGRRAPACCRAPATDRLCCPQSTDDTGLQILAMPPEMLPTVGLAEAYLGSTPVRQSNQCALASLVVEMALRVLGLQAESVALLLDVPDGRGGLTRYGNERPRMEHGQAIGHVGLIADGYFMDITASQFPEVLTHGGVRVVAAHLGDQQAEQLLTRGAILKARLADGYQVTYTAYASGSANGVLGPTLTSNGGTLPQLANNLLLIYGKLLSSPDLIERVMTLTEPRYANLVGHVQTMRSRELEHGADSLIRVR